MLSVWAGVCSVLDLHLETVKSTPLGLFRGLYARLWNLKSAWFYGHAVTAVFVWAQLCMTALKWTRKTTSYTVHAVNMAVFMCIVVSYSALMRLVLRTYCTFIYMYWIIQRPSKQDKLGPLRGADSFLGKWEPAGLDKHTRTHAHPDKPNHVLCLDSTLPGSVYLFYLLSLTSLSVLSFLSSASHTLRLRITFPLQPYK